MIELERVFCVRRYVDGERILVSIKEERNIWNVGLAKRSIFLENIEEY